MYSQSVGRKHSFQGVPPEYSTVVGLDGSTNLINVGVSCSDSALNQEIDNAPKKPARLQNKQGMSVEDCRKLSKTQNQYSIKSAELRRKSEASSNLHRDSDLTKDQKRDDFRRKSDVVLRKRQLPGVNYRGKYIPKDSVVLAHQRRSVVHVSGGSKMNRNVNYNTLPGGSRRAVTSQPMSSSFPGPSENPDWPVLSENECENNGNNSVIFKTGNYGISSVTESVKGFMKILHIPFQCCKRKVCRQCCSMLCCDFSLLQY
ncbi:uncharacterized protein LOC128550738 [Mercenaria mercenaria]|uniref:uncharacterized protein LOC128550738 n=1 Tax=Mercenaria mercenaria TaxID=6596 RepID=UPI00234E4361|nr:uncharacterized protein LOC128550738 [Mercenaria mercenaria]